MIYNFFLTVILIVITLLALRVFYVVKINNIYIKKRFKYEKVLYENDKITREEYDKLKIILNNFKFISYDIVDGFGEQRAAEIMTYMDVIDENKRKSK